MSDHWLVESMSRIFLACFFIEQCTRIYIIGPMFLQSPINIIDFSVILISIVAYVLKAANIDNWLSQNPSILTMVRLLRLVRACKVFRQFRSDSYFKELGMRLSP